MFKEFVQRIGLRVPHSDERVAQVKREIAEIAEGPSPETADKLNVLGLELKSLERQENGPAENTNS